METLLQDIRVTLRAFRRCFTHPAAPVTSREPTCPPYGRHAFRINQDAERVGSYA